MDMTLNQLLLEMSRKNKCPRHSRIKKIQRNKYKDNKEGKTLGQRHQACANFQTTIMGDEGGVTGSI